MSILGDAKSHMMKQKLRLSSLILIVGIHGFVFTLLSLRSSPHQTNLTQRNFLELRLIAPSSAFPISNVRHQTLSTSIKANLKTSKKVPKPVDTAWPTHSEVGANDKEVHLQTEGSEVMAAPAPSIYQLRQLALSDDRSVSKSPAQVIAEKNRNIETLESRLGKSTQKAIKKDCRTSYAGLGLLAAIPLTINAATDNLCKW